MELKGYIMRCDVDICCKFRDDSPNGLEVMCIDVQSHGHLKFIGLYFLNTMRCLIHFSVEQMELDIEFQVSRTFRMRGVALQN